MNKKALTLITEEVVAGAESASEGTEGKVARGKHPNSLKNLSKKGMTNNPHGTPGKTPIRDAMKKKLAELVPGDKKKRTFAQLIVDKAFDLAAQGDLKALIELTDRTEGKVKGELELSGNTPFVTKIDVNI